MAPRAPSRRLPDAATHIVVDTFLCFKGLERPFIVLAELAAGHLSHYDRRMHIGITRATARLLILATPEAVQADDRLRHLRPPAAP